MGMQYKKIKGVGKAPVPNPDDEPNFYKMEKCNPLPEVQSFSVPASVYLPPVYQTQTPARRPAISRIETYVTEDYEDLSVEELKSIYSQMSFPGPFTPPAILMGQY